MNSGNNSAQIIQLPQEGLNRRSEQIREVRASVEKKVTTLMQGMSEHVVEALFEEMMHLEEEAAMKCHFNIMRALKVEANILSEEFISLMDKSWTNLAQRKDKQAVADAEDDVTEVLKIYSDKNLNHYKILLAELRLRMGQLAKRDIAFHPLLPGNFYLCFWHATASLELTYQERRLLVPLFNRFVMDRYGQILSLANQSMVRLGIPAENYESPTSSQ